MTVHFGQQSLISQTCCWKGKVPASVQGALFGANLQAIAKKTGGIRPIAVGYVWRRLAAKVACSHVKEAATGLLAPRQLGFGISGGAEAAVRSARRYMENTSSGKLLVKIDFRNAFNTVRRDFVLEAVAKYYPQLMPCATLTMACSSDLQFGDFVLQSEEGAQQGDPLGPLYFCLACKELLESLKSELVSDTLMISHAVMMQQFVLDIIIIIIIIETNNNNNSPQCQLDAVNVALFNELYERVDTDVMHA